jgi:hypothetical protein
VANIFKAKTLVSRTGIFSHEVIAPNLVYNTGYQNIDGLKDFTIRPTVGTIPVLLSGEVSTTISGVLYSAQINIKNNNGSTIYKGQPVYVSSAAGTNILVKLASNSGEQTSSKTLGLVYQTSLAQNAQGTIVTEGLLEGFNTNAGEEGDPIWLGPTGSLIFGLANKPYAPNHLVYLGVLTRKHANQGEVFVKIQNGFELEELHNVNINHRNTLADKNIIRYDSLSGIWFNDTIDSVLPDSIVYTTGNQTITGIKTFAENTIFGDSAQGDFLIISGNTFTIYGSGNFTNGLFVSGVPVLTGVDLSSYATNANLFTTGSILNTKINNLSGYINSQDNILSGQIFNTGSRLDNKINSLSGYINSQNVVFSGQVASTGSILDNKINSLSGYVKTQDIIFSGQTFNTGSRLDNKINALSGVSVLTFGNQTISGFKTFATGVNIDGHVGIGINNNDKFGLYVRKSAAGVTVNPDDGSIAVFEGSGNSHITVLASNAQTAGVVLGSPADNFGSYLSWNHDNSALKLATAKTNGFIQILTNNENEAVRITRSGDVGIGTISPSEKLEVFGNIKASGASFINRPTVNGTGVLLSGQNSFILPFSNTTETAAPNMTYYFSNLAYTLRTDTGQA